MPIKDPFDISPDFLVPKSLKIPRWERDWFNDHKTINFNGLVKQTLEQVIKENDPEYYKQYKNFALDEIRRKETTPIPKIKLIQANTY